jgi:hypothetical protein
MWLVLSCEVSMYTGQAGIVPLMYDASRYTHTPEFRYRDRTGLIYFLPSFPPQDPSLTLGHHLLPVCYPAQIRSMTRWTHYSRERPHIIHPDRRPGLPVLRSESSSSRRRVTDQYWTLSFLTDPTLPYCLRVLHTAARTYVVPPPPARTDIANYWQRPPGYPRSARAKARARCDSKGCQNEVMWPMHRPLWLGARLALPAVRARSCVVCRMMR